MRSELIIYLLVALILMQKNQAFCAQNDGLTKIVKQSFNQLVNKGYQFLYKLSDGQSRDEVGSFDNDQKNLKVKGSYSYVGDDNKKYSVKYTADDNGYNAKMEVEEMPIIVKKPKIVDLSPAAIATLSTG